MVTVAGEAIFSANFPSRVEAAEHRKTLSGMRVCTPNHPLGSLGWETSEIKDNGEDDFELTVRFDIEIFDNLIHPGDNTIIVTRDGHEYAKSVALVYATSLVR